ncbi:MAG: hypothetical protein RR998_09465 [Oscillospiraceae bacterium]
MITVRELSQLRYLKREIALDRRRLIALKSYASYGKQRQESVQGGVGVSDRTGTCGCEIAYLSEMISQNIRRAICELLRLQSVINDIGDSETRQIFFERYVRGKSWLAVSFELGLSGEHVPRRIHNSYLREVNKGERTKKEQQKTF